MTSSGKIVPRNVIAVCSFSIKFNDLEDTGVLLASEKVVLFG